MRELAPALKESIEKGEQKILVTMAAGLKSSFYREILNCGDIPFIRLMPNTPASIGCGMTLVSVSSSCREEEASELEALLSAAGSFDRISEEQMDAAGTLTGCTPAFAYMFIEALADEMCIRDRDVVGSYSQQNTGLIHKGIGANKKIYPHLAANLRTYKAVQILKTGSLHSGAVGRNHLGLRETGA